MVCVASKFTKHTDVCTLTHQSRDCQELCLRPFRSLEYSHICVLSKHGTAKAMRVVACPPHPQQTDHTQKSCEGRPALSATMHTESLCVNPPNITTNSLRLVSSKILAIVKIYAPCPLPTKTIMGRLHAATTHRIISIPYTVRSLPFQIKDRNRHGAPANATRMPSTPLRIHPPKAPYHQNYFLRLLKPW
jgi:hypothetical protein